MKFAFIDTETTGLDPSVHCVIELAIIVVEDGNVVQRYTTKVRPTDAEMALAHPKALAINGYSEEEWSGSPSMETIGPYVLGILEGAVLVGHNVRFDAEMLGSSLRAHGVRCRLIRRRLVDTQVLAMEHLYPLGLASRGLDSIRKWLGWSTEGAHRAEKDALDCYRLWRLCWRMQVWTRWRVRLFRRLRIPV